MKHATLALLAALAFAGVSSNAVTAHELDNSPAVTPGLIVREDAQGNREVFKASGATQVENAETAAAANASFLTEANRIADVSPGTELDRASSSESWCYWYAPSYPGYYYYTYSTYRYGNPYYVSYYPTYYYNAYGYRYYYYWYRY
jgi:hypothetical protein